MDNGYELALSNLYILTDIADWYFLSKYFNVL